MMTAMLSPPAMQACFSQHHHHWNWQQSWQAQTFNEVREKSDVAREAKRDGATVHFARIFDFCV